MPKKNNEKPRAADNSKDNLEARGKEQVLSSKSGQKTNGGAPTSKAQSPRHPRAGKGL